MKYLIFCLFLGALFFTSCQGNSVKDAEDDGIVMPEFGADDDEGLSLEERAKKQAMAKIGIPANEDFSFKIYPAYLNNDNVSDAFITINRLNYAIESTKGHRDIETLKKNGFVGNYNFIMIYDGESNQFSIPIPIPSSAAKELEVDFVNLFSDEYVTAEVTYRIKNTEFKNFYSVSDGIMEKIFKMITYDQAGEKDVHGYVYEIQEEGQFSSVKNILTYEAVLENSEEIGKDWFTPEAKLKKTDRLYKRWFYDPKRASYVTPDR